MISFLRCTPTNIEIMMSLFSFRHLSKVINVFGFAAIFEADDNMET